MPVRPSVAVVVALCASPTTAAARQIQFTEVSRAVGLEREHVDPAYLMGGGGAFLDHDGDGDLDVLVYGSVGSPWLYRNTGGTFADVTAGSGLTPGPSDDHPMAVACADVENDGDTDVFLVADGRSRLFTNTLDGAALTPFVDATAAAGIDVDVFSSGAAFGDYDNDGFLDLYVGNYIKEIQFPSHVPERNVLLRNRGDGTFEDVTDACGVGGRGTALAVTFTDADDDCDLDLWVGNDFGEFVHPNELFLNEGPGPSPGRWSFAERAAAAGADQAIYCMGIAFGDIDHDLDLDAYVTNLGRNVLLRKDGSTFVDHTTAAGVEAARDPTQLDLLATSWACGFFDFDRDTWVDLYVSNGHIPAASFIANGKQTPNQLFRNRGTGDGTFDDVTFAAGVAHPEKGRGAAFGDYDGDGDIDILQLNVDGRAVRLYRNDSPGDHGSLRVLPVGRRAPRTAIGTRVTARFAGLALLHEANPNLGFESSSDPAVFIGTGAHPRIPHLELAWRTGVIQDVHDLPARGAVTLLEPLLTLDGAVQGAGTGKVAQPWTGDVPLTNHAARRLRATLSVRFTCGSFEVDGPTWTRDVDAGATLRVPVGLTLPDPGAAGGPVMRVVVRVTDAAGGVDEASAAVTLLP